MWCVFLCPCTSQTNQSCTKESERETTSQPTWDNWVRQLLLFRHSKGDSLKKKLHLWGIPPAVGVSSTMQSNRKLANRRQGLIKLRLLLAIGETTLISKYACRNPLQIQHIHVTASCFFFFRGLRRKDSPLSGWSWGSVSTARYLDSRKHSAMRSRT